MALLEDRAASSRGRDERIAAALAEEFAIAAGTHPNLGPRTGTVEVARSRSVAFRRAAPEHARRRAGENRRADGKNVSSHRTGGQTGRWL